jgi:DNA invertase Pin-like site-specific DNA recombinase
MLLQEHARRSGYAVYGVYVDHAQRQAGLCASLGQLLADAAKGRFDRVLVADASRLGRSAATWGAIAALEGFGVQLEDVSATPQMDRFSAIADVVGRQEIDLARRHHGERTARGIALAKKKRKRQGKRR